MHQTATAEDWYPEHEELPRRARARLLTPFTVLLMLVLFAACGFIGGVLVQKQQQTTATVVGAAASTRLGTGATGASGASGGFGGRFSSLLGGGAGSRATVGTVTNIDGRKLFVTTAAGTMVEVLTTPESKITKSVSVGSKSVHPGDSVVVSGIKASNGSVTASSVSDSGSAGSAGGISSLFGTGTGTGAGTGSTTSSGGSTSLFGG
jgi:hypothetical protein